jgi:hypothetical protein
LISQSRGLGDVYKRQGSIQGISSFGKISNQIIGEIALPTFVALGKTEDSEEMKQ